MTSLELIGVVGGGAMGSGIAEVCARAHLEVVVCESNASRAALAEDRTAASLARAVHKGKLTLEEADRARRRLRYVHDVEALAGCDLVIEAIVEDPAAKMDLFAALDTTVKPGAILASNTSSVPIINLAMATQRPEAVIGVHFFNPVPVMPLVEVVTSLKTSTSTIDRATTWVSTVLGRHVVNSPDRAGFVVNALLVPYLLSAIRMLESGFASAEDIDAGMRLGCAHPMGPLELADLIGLDTTAAIADSMYHEFKEPLYSPPALLMRMVKAQRLCLLYTSPSPRD